MRGHIRILPAVNQLRPRPPAQLLRCRHPALPCLPCPHLPFPRGTAKPARACTPAICCMSRTNCSLTTQSGCPKMRGPTCAWTRTCSRRNLPSAAKRCGCFIASRAPLIAVASRTSPVLIVPADSTALRSMSTEASSSHLSLTAVLAQSKATRSSVSSVRGSRARKTNARSGVCRNFHLRKHS